MKKIILAILGLPILYILSIVFGTVIHYYIKRFFTFSATNILAIWVIAFVLSSMLKINPASKFFLFNLILSVFLVSFYPFGQGLIIFLVLIFSQKLLKII